MIDPHVHLRDWNQAHKETLRHGFSVAWRAGLDAVFEMPNTDPPLTSRQSILRRIDDADRALAALRIPLVHCLYAGLTADPGQITEAVEAWRELFPRVAGLKMFAGHSTGNMGIVEKSAQAVVYRRLAAARVHRRPGSALREGSAAQARRVGSVPALQPRPGAPPRRRGGIRGRPEGAGCRGRFRGDAACLPYLDPVGAGRAAGHARAERPGCRGARDRA